MESDPVNRRKFSAGRRARWAAVIAVLPLFAAACSSASSTGSAASAGGTASGSAGSSGSPLTIYAVAGETGADAPVSPLLLAGLQAGVSMINAKGGILGRKVVLTIANDQSDPTQAVSLVQSQLTGGNPPDLVYGGTGSAENLAVSGVTSAAKVFTLGVGSSNVLGNAAQFPYTFTVNTSAATEAKSSAQYLKSKGYKNIGLLSSDDAAGISISVAYTAALKAAGLNLVDAESYPDTAIDMSPELERINSHHPDAVIVEGVNWGAYLIQSRLKAGMGNVPFLADSATQAVDYSAALTPAEKQGVTMQVNTVNVDTTTSPGKTALLNALNKNGVKLVEPLYVYAVSSDILLSYANAAIAVHSTDPTKVKAELETGNVPETFPTALATSFNWTPTLHLVTQGGLYEFIPVDPVVKGQYVTSGS